MGWCSGISVPVYSLLLANHIWSPLSQELVSTSDSHLVDSFLRLVEIIMNEACADEEALNNADRKVLKCWIIGAFMFATVWSVGATCDEAGREKFSNFLKELTIGECPDHPIPQEVGMKIDCTFPKEGSVYDYKFLIRGKGQWYSWKDSIVPLTATSISIREIIVPTVDTVRYSYLMDLSIRHRRSLHQLREIIYSKDHNKTAQSLPGSKAEDLFSLIEAQFDNLLQLAGIHKDGLDPSQAKLQQLTSQQASIQPEEVNPSLVPPSQNILAEYSQRHTLLLYPAIETSQDLPTLLNETLPASEFKIKGLHSISKNGIAVSFNSEEDKSSFNNIIQHNERIASKILTKQPGVRHPSIIIKNVPTSIQLEEIQSTIQSYTKDSGLLRARFQFPGSKLDTNNWVLESPATVLKELIHIKKIPLRWKMYQISEFFHIKRCNFCQAYGHTTKNCHHNIPSCATCAGYHSTRDCLSDYCFCACVAGRAHRDREDGVRPGEDDEGSRQGGLRAVLHRFLDPDIGRTSPGHHHVEAGEEAEGNLRSSLREAVRHLHRRPQHAGRRSLRRAAAHRAAQAVLRPRHVVREEREVRNPSGGHPVHRGHGASRWGAQQHHAPAPSPLRRDRRQCVQLLHYELHLLFRDEHSLQEQPLPSRSLDHCRGHSVCDGRHLQRSDRQSAANARQIPLHVQPERFRQSHPRMLPHQKGISGKEEDTHQVDDKDDTLAYTPGLQTSGPHQRENVWPSTTNLTSSNIHIRTSVEQGLNLIPYGTSDDTLLQGHRGLITPQHTPELGARTALCRLVGFA
ncbi:Dynein heavy chain 12, axonemal [Araneus ventricosus]|uniref:Dynein heavy chain 12, axonemal n=1 Tax=Araneus ventricosus TaxID=182803 RepID=A0A4Y2JDB9_ARAVE|nr:Dynein heavy chain 12, axonemal [Araneus ventricosus]